MSGCSREKRPRPPLPRIGHQLLPRSQWRSSSAVPPPGDATNYLDGIADVLQDKTNPRNIDLPHLGDLQAVALYHDDPQISEINYRVARADSPSYTVRITVLSEFGVIGTDIHSYDDR